MAEVGTVGKKGEIYAPKKLREVAGFKPGSRVLFELDDSGKITMERLPTILELLKRPKIARITPEEIKRYRRELMEETLANIDKELEALKKK